jgi:predicted RND superfamily exporter protein
VIAMIPNAFPITVITGLMGWLGVRLNMGAAMIAAVSMGLAVDASIHYIAEYLEARRHGRSVQAALHSVHQRAGRALVFSTMALIVGFMALCLSQFVPLIYFGVLMSLSMLGGLIGNLVLLPLLLQWASRWEKAPEVAAPTELQPAATS